MLVYSTCTFSPEENEGTVGWFLRAHPEFSLEDVGVSFGCAGHPSCCVEGEIETEKVRRIYPVHGGEGQFMARLRKAGDAPAALPAKGKLCPKKLPEPAAAFFAEQFPDLAQEPFALAGDRVVLLPKAEVALPKGLRVLRTGVATGELVRGRGRTRFEPAHSLYMACGARAANRLDLVPEDPRTAGWLRGEEIAADPSVSGWVAVTVSGFPLGMGKAGGGRVKNHYPKGLRNLK